MLSFKYVKGNGKDLKNNQLVIFNDENNEIIEIGRFIHKDSQPDIELEDDLINTKKDLVDLIEFAINHPHNIDYKAVLIDIKRFLETKIL